MEKVNVRKQDEILMSLVHYFVTKEGYAPIYVQGDKKTKFGLKILMVLIE